MKRRTLIQSAAFAMALAGANVAMAQHTHNVIFGKNNEWLFTPYEFAAPSDAAETQASIQMLTAASRLFQRNGVALAVAIVPSKVRIHSDNLPTDRPLDTYTRDKYQGIVQALRAGGVNVVDLNSAFLASPHRTSDTPLFLRLDTHWSPSGAMTAAETIKAGIESIPSLKAALAATPAVKFAVEWAPRKTATRSRDLVRLLPPGAASFPAEQVLNFKVTREQTAQAGLLGSGENVGITIIGSSFSNKNTGYPDAVRFALQRELLDISLPVDQGPWSGMVGYLSDDAFKTRKPKLIVWEIPEREFRSPPNAKYREARYQIENNDWLNRMGNLLP